MEEKADAGSENPRERGARALGKRVKKALPYLLIAALAAGYVAWRVGADRPDPLGAGDPYQVSRMMVRNQLFLLADELNRRLRRGEPLPEAFRVVAQEVLRSSALSDYSLYLDPTEAVRGARSRMPRQGALLLEGPDPPVPSHEGRRGRYTLVAVRLLGEASRVEAWKITSAREIAVGEYELVPAQP